MAGGWSLVANVNESAAARRGQGLVSVFGLAAPPLGAFRLQPSRGIIGLQTDLRACNMAHPDLELLRLEQALTRARERLTWIVLKIADPPTIKAAEDLYAEAVAAVRAHAAASRGHWS
jgi:hypothetical protein